MMKIWVLNKDHKILFDFLILMPHFSLMLDDVCIMSFLDLSLF